MELTEKIGARHGKNDNALIQQMHDAAVRLGAQCMVERAGKRHNSRDRQALQKVHDACVALGATCAENPTRKADHVRRGIDEVVMAYRSGAIGLVRRAQADAPDYQAASNPRRCKNCRHFAGDPGRDWCDKYKFTADPDYTCRGYAAQEKDDEIPGYKKVAKALAEIIIDQS